MQSLHGKLDSSACHESLNYHVLCSAMNGGVKFEVALDERLRLIKPTRGMMSEMEAARPSVLSPKVDVLVTSLRSRGVDVYLVSGGMKDVRCSSSFPFLCAM